MRILMISPINFYPPIAGDRVRITKVYQGLSEENEVTLVYPFRSGIDKSKIKDYDNSQVIPVESPNLKLGKKILALFSPWPYHTSLFFSEGIARKVNELINSGGYELIYCHFIHTLLYIKGFDIPIILDQHNVDRVYWKRKVVYYKSQKNYFGYIITLFNLWKTIQYERRMLPNLTAIVSVSENDLLITKEYAKLYVPNFLLGFNGVDINHYKKNVLSYSKTVVLGFLGSLDLNLNQDAVLILIKELLPRIRVKLPEYNISVLIIGKDPPKSITRLASKNVQVTGTVPDVLVELQKVDILVLPLRHGAGTKLRVFEAMSTGVCIVGSELAFYGIDGLIPNKHAIIAESLDDFVNATCFLVENFDERLRISNAARKLVEEKYNWDSITSNLSSELNRIVEMNNALHNNS